MAPILDKLGQEIIPGSLIVYGHALGRCAALRVGEVIKVVEVPLTSWRDQFWRYKPEYRITVRGVNDDMWDVEGHGLMLTRRLGTLMFPDRMVVLPDALVPAAYRALLAEAPRETK